MTLEFVKFPSLENHYRENVVHKARELGYENELYLITEKVHGANFSFHTKVTVGEPTEFKPAKRTDFIADDESFYGCRPVIAKYKDRVIALAEAIARGEKAPDCNIVIYGELYGGKVQNAMSYKKEQDFVAFGLNNFNN